MNEAIPDSVSASTLSNKHYFNLKEKLFALKDDLLMVVKIIIMMMTLKIIGMTNTYFINF